MKPQQPSSTHPTSTTPPAERLACRVRASLPALGVIALAIASSVVVTLGGCANSAGIVGVAAPIAPASVGLDAGGAAATAPAIAADWWQGFGDPALTGLVERALADNPGPKVAQARLARAEAAVSGAQAAAGPQVNGSLDVTYQRFSETSIYPPPLGGSVRTLGAALVTGSWELDFFGRNHAAIEAAVGVQRAAQAEAQGARIVLASSVVKTYVQLGRLFELRDVAAGALQQREDTLALIRQRVQAGLDTNVELREGEGALPETRQQIEFLDEQIMLARHALAALTAQPMNALDGLEVKLRVVQVTPLPAAIPADLLGRRADITAARWRIEAAGSDVQNAKAQFYPNVNLVAFAGVASIGLNRLIQGGSQEVGIGPAIRLPIFDSGRLRANLSVKTADLDAAIESYNGAVLDALRETADPIGSLRSIPRQQAEQARAQAAAESAFDLAMQRYKAGLGTYLTVLNAQTTVLNRRAQAVELKSRGLDAQVALIRALGGGYAADAVAVTRMAHAGS